MVVSFLALSLGTITFENPGIRLELFLKEISKQTGVGFHCPPYLNNEVLAASFKDQSIDILKSQLARVIHGTWEQKEDGWWLIQSSDQKKEEEKWVWETRNTVLQMQIDAFKVAEPKSEWTTKEANKYWMDLQASKKRTGEDVMTSANRMALRMRSPESRLGSAIASQLTVNMLTDDPLKPNFNRYSVNGLPGHINLPIKFGDAFPRYVNERQLFQALGGNVDVKGRPVNFELSYSTGERGYFFIQWLDKDWRYLGSWFPIPSFESKKFEPKGEIFKVSDSTRDILALQKEINAGSEAAPVFEKYQDSPLLKEAVISMFQATKQDPLGIIQGRCWIDFAKSVNRPLLVNLKDDEDIPRPSLHVPLVVQNNFVFGMKREDADGWVLGRPINPLFNRSWRMDRKLIEEYARLTTTPNTPNFYPILQKSRIGAFIAYFTTGIPNQAFLLDDLQINGYVSGVFGSLPEDQLNACLRGARIPVSSLPTHGLELMNFLLRDGVFTELSPVAKDDSISLCPLYYLPNGTKGMSLGAFIKIEPEFRFATEPVQEYGTVFDINSFADLIKEARADSPVFDSKFSLVSQRIFVATFHLGNKSMSEETIDPTVQTNMPTYTWKTLPDSVRQQVLEAMKRPTS